MALFALADIPLFLLISLLCLLLEQPTNNKQYLVGQDQSSRISAAVQRRGARTIEVLSALCDMPSADMHISAIMCRSLSNMIDFAPFLSKQTVKEWRDLDLDSST